VLHAHGVGAFRELNERAVEVEEQAAAPKQINRGMGEGEKT
jgi:hypothetical protein